MFDMQAEDVTEVAVVKDVGGRPTDYSPALCETVLELGRQGKSHTQISATLDVSRQTLFNWQNRYPDFDAAIKRAYELSQAWFEDQGQIGLFDNRFNANAWNKQVSGRFRNEYGERQVIAGDPDAPLAGMSEAQIEQRLRALIEKQPELSPLLGIGFDGAA